MKGSRASSLRFRRVGIVAKTASAPALRLASALETALRRRRREVFLDDGTAEVLGRRKGVSRERIAHVSDLVLVLGGDGTLLSVARSAPSGTPLLGIKVGLLGFLATLSQRQALARLDELLAGGFREDRRRRLDVSVAGGPAPGTYRVLNDAVFHREALARISTFSISLDGRRVAEFRADGVIVSTPTGSTAYNLSAGGPILHPALPAIVITPICPHTLAQRPLVVPASTEIRVCVDSTRRRREGGVYLTLDGQEGFPLPAGIPVDIRSSGSPVTLLRPPETDHFDQLAGKLSWGV
jgi:NAD+ kinase